jgi:hypothetical protein
VGENNSTCLLRALSDEHRESVIRKHGLDQSSVAHWVVRCIELFRLVTLPDAIVVAGSILPPMYMRLRTFQTNRYASYNGRTALVKPHPNISQPMSIHTVFSNQLQLQGELGSISSYGERRPASGNNLARFPWHDARSSRQTRPAAAGREGYDKGVFGSLYHIRFTLPPQISQVIQAGLRFWGCVW